MVSYCLIRFLWFVAVACTTLLVVDRAHGFNVYTQDQWLYVHFTGTTERGAAYLVEGIGTMWVEDTSTETYRSFEVSAWLENGAIWTNIEGVAYELRWDRYDAVAKGPFPSGPNLSIEYGNTVTGLPTYDKIGGTPPPGGEGSGPTYTPTMPTSPTDPGYTGTPEPGDTIFTVELKPLDLGVVGIPSSTTNIDLKSDWYINSALKPMVDAVMLAFAAATAIWLPIQETRKI